MYIWIPLVWQSWELPFSTVQEGLGGAAACSTLGLLLQGMLAALSNLAMSAQLLAEGAAVAATSAQPSVGRQAGGNGSKAAGSRPLVIQLKPRGKLKAKPDAQGASGDTALCSTTLSLWEVCDTLQGCLLGLGSWHVVT